MKKIILLLLPFLLICLYGEANAKKNHPIPTLNITVIDSQTEKPLSGIRVHHMVISETNYTVFPLTIEAHIHSSILVPETAQTDSNGKVVFKNLKVELKSYWLLPKEQVVNQELIFINLDPSQNLPEYRRGEDIYSYLWRELPFLENLDRPNKDFFGYVLGIADIPESHEREVDNFATYRWEPGDFDRLEERNFVVKLKPFSSLDAQPSNQADEMTTGGSR